MIKIIFFYIYIKEDMRYFGILKIIFCTLKYEGYLKKKREKYFDPLT